MATDDVSERRALLTTAIVGGGPSGVEMAATLADLLPCWYETLGGHGLEIRIVLLNPARRFSVETAISTSDMQYGRPSDRAGWRSKS